MRNKLSRVLAMILAATMTVNTLPMSVFATTLEPPSQNPPVEDEFNDQEDDELDDDEVVHPEGTIENEDGTFTYPDGTIHDAEGNLIEDKKEASVHPEGSIENEDGTYTWPDGTIHDADGNLIEEEEEALDDDDSDNADNKGAQFGAQIISDDDYSAELAEVDDDNLKAALEDAKKYIDAMTINNTSNDPATVVKNFNTHFSWDNEHREDPENKKTTLFDWSYYNGVVFEGLEYVYEVLGEKAYAEYVVEYMSSLIAEDGTWAVCDNNSSKTCAGYDANHGADTFKTASLLLDMYKITGDNRYLTMAGTIYNDLKTGGTANALKSIGYNYKHTWSTEPSPDLWLDGLYMTLPFQAEYAAYIGDADMLDDIVDRMQWVSDYMYNESTKLFYHAADNDKSNSGTYWLRAIGWYAAAMTDIMDHMSGENLTKMEAQLKKLVDGMRACQNTSNGMWLNNVTASQTSTNPYETSGTALVCYAVMKAVNEDWLDDDYADMAELAFWGICNKKLDVENTVLKDICLKGVPNNSNSTIINNEGKGVGPFIMLYAEMYEHVYELNHNHDKPLNPQEPEEPEVPAIDVVEDTVIVGNSGEELVVTKEEVKEEDKAVLDEQVDMNLYEDYIALDVSADLAEGEKATVTLPIPAAWLAEASRIVGISIEDGVLKEIPGTVNEDNTFSFEVDHFSAKGIALAVETYAFDSNIATGNLAGKTEYVLYTENAIIVGSDNRYVVVGSGSKNQALTLDGSKINSTAVTITDDGKLTVNDKNISAEQYEFYFADNNQEEKDTYLLTQNGTDTVYHEGGGMNYGADSDSRGHWYVKKVQNEDAYYIYDNDPGAWYLNYGVGPSWIGNNLNRFTVSSQSQTVRLFKANNTAGDPVTFKVTPAEVNLYVSSTDKKTATLTPEVLRNDTAVASNGYTIVWSSANDSVATVANGVVTARGKGTTTIIATLTKIGNTNMQSNISVSIPVYVEDKELDPGFTPILSGNRAVTTPVNAMPRFSGLTLTVKFKGDNQPTVITPANGLEVSGITTLIKKPGFAFADVIYRGVKYGTVKVTVEGDPYAGVADAEVYPEYPQAGAVRIDKTATQNAEVFKTTGVTHVELDVAGVSSKTGVDAVLTIDISNSMAWAQGTTTDDLARNKLTEVMESIVEFAKIFLKDNDDGTPTDNTITIVTFAGKDSDHWNNTDDNIDSVLTLVSKTNSLDIISEIAQKTKFTAGAKDYRIQLGYVNQQGEVDTIEGVNRGDTNYDYAFAHTRDAVTDLELGAGDREVYVLFMTDGCASNYNNNYYRTKNATHALTPNNTYYENANYGSGLAWVSRIEETIKNNLGNIYARELHKKVDGIYAVGFDMAHGSFSGLGTWETSVDWETRFNNIVSKSVTDDNGNGLIPVTAASDIGTLRKFYTSLATELRYAGTNAQATDIIGSNFTLQMASQSGSGDDTANLMKEMGRLPEITVTEHTLYTKATAANAADIGKRTGESNVLEKVTFNAEGTEAYSSELDSTTNIMTVSGGTTVINAKYFTYTKASDGTETFNWLIGNITDKEITLGFDVYLKGALEGEQPQQMYYTNESAVLDYIDVNGRHATQTFPIPSVYWGSATTTMRFYLVNAAGQPVNRNGDLVTPANLVYLGDPTTVTLNWNEDGSYYASIVEAAANLPEGYVLYDSGAGYTVQTASSSTGGNTIEPGVNIKAPTADASKDPQTGAQTTILIDFEAPQYTWSVVGFGVRYDLTVERKTPLNPDQVVIDYGKAVQFDVLANDKKVLEEKEGFVAKVVGFATYNSSLKTEYPQNDNGDETYVADNGTFTVDDAGNTQYQPTKMVIGVDEVFCVVRFTNENNPADFYYMYQKMEVIPATIMYYETDFAGGVFKTDEVSWDSADDGLKPDGPQDCVTIGSDLYGYDSSYTDDCMLSNSSSLYAEGKGVDTTWSTFSFTGTGFDLISCTGTEQGIIKVQVYSDAEMHNCVKTISVLNKSEKKLTLYQIPVVSVNGLTHGTYYVKIGVDKAFSHDTLTFLNRGNQFYFDAIRIFDPIYVKNVASATDGSDAKIAYEAYVADGESNNQIIEVRSKLIGQLSYDLDNEVEGLLFVDAIRDAEGNPIEGAGVEWSDYTTVGPNNEAYIYDEQGIGFRIDLKNGIPASIHIGAKSADGNPVGLSVQTYVGNVDDATYELNPDDTEALNFSSATAQYFDILGGQTLTSTESLYVTISNTGTGILSITDLKIAYGNAAGTVSVMSDANVLEKLTGVVNDNIETDNEAKNYDVISAEFTEESIKRNTEATLIVTTPEAVESIIVSTTLGRNEEFEVVDVVTENGLKVWTLKKVITTTGTKTYRITGYSATDVAGAPVEAKIKVKR